MQENNNELENLYGKAAEHFPLKTGSADWQAVLKQLEKDDNKKPFWWNIKTAALSLFLIGFIVGSVFIVSKFFENKTALNKAFLSKQTTEKQLEEIKNQNKNLEQTITNKIYKKIIDSLNKQNIVASIKSDITGNKNTVISKKLHKTISTKPLNEDLNIKKFVVSKSEMSSIIKEPKIAETIAVVDSQKSTDKNNAKSNELGVANNEGNTEGEITTATNNITKVDSLKKVNTTAVIDVPKNKKVFRKYFYVGAMYASQKCSVQSEGFKDDGDDVGYNVSFLVGYKFSKIFSLETGLSVQSKEYYTTSNKFDKNILPATGNILWVEAENKLIEIPLSLKVDLLHKNNNNFFANIGVCSYIVSKENYEYEQENNGIVTNEKVQYKTTTNNFLGAYNLSVGYQYQFKKIGGIRIQPYLSIPLNGVGKGNQPIVSKGIYFGWIYNFKIKN